MSTVVSNEAKNLPPRPVDPPGITGEQLLTQSTNKAADAKKLKEQEDRIAGLETKGAEDALKLKEKDNTITGWEEKGAEDALKLKGKDATITGWEEKGAEDALKLKEKDKTITTWKGIAGAFGILSLALSSELVWKITEWQGFIVAYTLIFGFIVAFATLIFVYSSIVFLDIIAKM